MSADPRSIPPSRRVECEQCGDVIDRQAKKVARLATAWIPNRGSEGGANAIVDPVWTERFLCRHCVDQRRKGIRWKQESLFP